jgi:hypothetical protein
VGAGGMTAAVLSGDPQMENTLANPRMVAPNMIVDGDPYERELPAHSLNVFTLGIVMR